MQVRRWFLALAAATVACAGLWAATGPGAETQGQRGAIEFVVQATPSGGLAEPVRGFPVYLLSESYGEIEKEAEAAFPKEKLDDFIEGLSVSAPMKEWMKRNQWITFSGHDFIQKVKPDDILNVPEFYQAYLDRNSGEQSAGFPQAKFRPADKDKDPAKYAKDVEKYRETLRRYLDEVPESINGIDLNLADVDPGRKWREMEARRDPQVQRRMLELAQGKYLIARTETNLQGQGFIPNVAPGTYWLSSLDLTATVGDARPRWDVPLTVRPGETSYAQLSNVNAVAEAAHASP